MIAPRPSWIRCGGSGPTQQMLTPPPLRYSFPSAASACSFNSLVSCSKVGSSGHTTTLGVPDWLWGIGGFLVLLGIDLRVYRTWDRRALQFLAGLSAVGALLSAWFVYNGLFLIQAVCPVCTVAQAANAVVLAASIALLRISSGPEPDAHRKDDRRSRANH